MEHASRDCFNYGGALAEVMSLYENMSDNQLMDTCQEGKTEVKKQGNNQLEIEVCY